MPDVRIDSSTVAQVSGCGEDMISTWWLVFTLGLTLAFGVWHGRMAYRQGIWDGARNQFLPHVKREVDWYDGRRP